MYKKKKRAVARITAICLTALLSCQICCDPVWANVDLNSPDGGGTA